MSESTYMLTQADIFKDLLEGTIQGGASGRSLKHTKIVAGANATNLAFRNSGKGLPYENTEALDDLASLEVSPYPLEPLTHLDLCELQWFRDGICTSIHYSRGILLSRGTVANEAPAGLLIRLGWDNPLKEGILTTEMVRDVVQQTISQYSHAKEIEIWFNGERVD